MIKIGIIAAVELSSFMKKYSGRLVEEKARGFRVYSLDLGEKLLYIAQSGAGEIRAAACTQMLIDLYDVDLIINYGIVGALSKELAVANTCVVKRVVHYDMDTSAADGFEVGRYAEYDSIYLSTTAEYVAAALSADPSLIAVTSASGDKFIADEAGKKKLRDHFKADICDMESAAIVLTCDQNGIPNLIIKTVSDSVQGGAEEFAACAEKAADICLAAVDKIIKEAL